MVANAESISLSLLALRTRVSIPRERAAACAAIISASLFGLLGFIRKAMAAACGKSSCSSCIRLVTATPPNIVIPVALPPGRLRVATRPSLTGSPLAVNTIGIVWVAALADCGEGSPPVAAITATCRRTNSAANSGSRSNWPCAQRYSTATFWPSTKPVSLRPWRNARKRSAYGSGNSVPINPITGTAVCCARTGSGHAAAAPPRRLMNLRRRISAPRLKGKHCTGSNEYLDRAQTWYQNHYRSAHPMSQMGH